MKTKISNLFHQVQLFHRRKAICMSFGCISEMPLFFCDPCLSLWSELGAEEKAKLHSRHVAALHHQNKPGSALKSVN